MHEKFDTSRKKDTKRFVRKSQRNCFLRIHS